MKIVKCDKTNEIIMTWAVQSDTFFDSLLTHILEQLKLTINIFQSIFQEMQTSEISIFCTHANLMIFKYRLFTYAHCYKLSLVCFYYLNENLISTSIIDELLICSNSHVHIQYINLITFKWTYMSKRKSARVPMLLYFNKRGLCTLF